MVLYMSKCLLITIQLEKDWQSPKSKRATFSITKDILNAF